MSEKPLLTDNSVDPVIVLTSLPEIVNICIVTFKGTTMIKPSPLYNSKTDSVIQDIFNN